MSEARQDLQWWHSTVIVFLCYNINVSVQHISGTENKIASAISCFQDIRFRELAPDAEATPTNIPAWPAQALKITSCSSAIMVLPSQHIKHTSVH